MYISWMKNPISIIEILISIMKIYYLMMEIHISIFDNGNTHVFRLRKINKGQISLK